MRFQMNCGPDSRCHAGPGSFGPGGFNFDFGQGFGANFGGRHGRGGGHRRSRSRMFEGGELRLVLLKLLADQPRHGYELIKAIEEMTGGDYAPSPGIVYPTLTMLEDMGQIAEKKSPDSKKVYQATAEGRAYLEENADEVEALMDRLKDAGVERRRHARPEIGRAIGNMMAALKNRVGRDGWNDALLEEITDILDEAAKKIERIGG